jgi:regulator of protease activity HflC (stomatin/prohibitin superfamily)
VKNIRPLFTAAASQEPVVAPRPPEPESALSAALRTAFRFLYAVVAVLALVWLGSGIRTVDPGMQAVVLRAGAIDRVVPSGLALGLPRPFEEIVLVPGPERQLNLKVNRLDLNNREQGEAPAGAGLDPRKDGGYALTGDAGVVHLQGTVTYTVSDPRAYVLSRERVPAALERVFLAATIDACAGRSLDGVMVASPDSQSTASNESQAQSRERLRGDIVADANRRLVAMAIGIAVTRVDLTAFLPDKAKPSFDAVIAAEGSAAKEIAEARTAAAKLLQDSNAQRDALIAQASAKAQETLTSARVVTDGVRAVLSDDSPEHRAQRIAQIYQTRIATIIRNAGGVLTVPAGEPAKLWLPGR